MAIKTECPRCRKPLSVPEKKAGNYVSCPHCRGRFWVEKDAPGNSPSGAVAAPSGDAPSSAVPTQQAPTQQAPTREAPTQQAPTQQAPTSDDARSPWYGSPPAGSTGASAASQGPADGRKVARFVSAEAAKSTLKIAEDGQLPQLRLQEVKQKEGPRAKSTAVNPLVLFGVISLSVVLSISLTLVDTDSGRDSDSRAVRYAREVIESEFFGDIGGDNPDVATDGGLQRYQILLREAQRAYSQGDLKTERERYRSVLGLLWAERGPHQKGLTGSRERDQRLEGQIAIILGNQ